MPQNQLAKILIVDDTINNIRVLGTILKREGYQINVAQNGKQALTIIEKVLPDLILLDVMMPEMDGFETCAYLKNNNETKEIPIIFLTAKTETENIVKGFELGAVDYITKPFQAAELIVRVQTHLELKFSRDMIQTINQEQKELLHILCHDLANPMNSIITVLNLMKSYKDFKRMHELLLTSVHNGLEVISLVREMRSLEEKTLTLMPLNLTQAVKESIQVLNQRFVDKGIQIEIHMEDKLIVCAERVSLINSVLNNLLTNAIKFSYPQSTIQIQAHKTPEAIIFTVRDFGIGMPQSLVNDLFDIRKTTNRSGTQGERGTGFGMPLVKKFVTAYGASLKVSAQEPKQAPEDHGTIVEITFPLTVSCT
ncbi:MAG: hybrid sensor histidine kinase/response regulator [Pseudomonadota bacterium]|nr:hybrid sensor histidine kinase/response regulator [Pseudomonadota bacterium]